MSAPLRTRVKAPTGEAWPSTDPKFLERYPLLCGFLTCSDFDGPTPTERGTFLLLVEPGGILKICLHDRVLGEKCWLTCSSVEEALWFSEEAIAGLRGEWRKVNGAWSGSQRQRRS